MDSVYFSNKRAHANRNFNSFGGSVAQSFNNGTMFEEFDGFSGIASDDLRGFKNASGCGSYNASGRTLSAEKSNPVMDGRYANVGRGFVVGPTYTDRKRRKRRPSAVAPAAVAARQGSVKPTLDPYGRKSRRDSADRVSVAPVGGVGRQTAGGADCGQGCGQRGLGIVRRCQNKGCVCDDINSPSGTCVPAKSRLASTQATARQMNFSHHSNFVAPVRGFKPARSFSGGSSRCALDR